MDPEEIADVLWKSMFVVPRINTRKLTKYLDWRSGTLLPVPRAIYIPHTASRANINSELGANPCMRFLGSIREQFRSRIPLPELINDLLREQIHVLGSLDQHEKIN